MTDTIPVSTRETRGSFPLPRNARYTRVAIWLHWAIAFFILYNLVLGFFNWDFGAEFTHKPQNRWIYGLILVSHMSAGITVLALTVLRIVWRLLHEPPAYPAHMKSWERHTAHFAHFLLYAAMLLMPLTGWAILSAHPPEGSAGAKARAEAMAKAGPPPGAAPGGAPAAAGAGGPPPMGPGAKGPPAPKIWWIIPMPQIMPLANIGKEPGGVEPLETLHDEIAEWHGVGAWLTVLVLVLHIAGALKHQIIDREPQFARMGIGRFPEEKE
ncbi:putative cytochrome b-561 protein [Novosphingobium sp. Rr 2-17]|uniref:cytochrome b n=1 Tax=Novosphingobium sp. Rr 2-17 TaxID=555793 RepID=UPI00026994F1|nr:cytochrome b/b6 domain-containing protein [Novosphingobium sp. Rr 2-17]EIZ79919.1 putative cytochrome b-561 protein [Novosphingobium sp. Rr 2-17]